MEGGETQEFRYIHLVLEGEGGGGTYIELGPDDELGDWWAEREIGLNEDLEPEHRAIGIMGVWADSDLALSDWERRSNFTVIPITKEAFDDKWEEAEVIGVPAIDGAGFSWGCVVVPLLFALPIVLLWLLWRLLAALL